MKTCTKCGEAKPATDFSKSAKGRGGMQARCKECACIATAEYLAANPDKAKAATIQWKADNTEKRKVYDAKYRANNHAKRKAAKAKWAADNPEAARTYQHNRNASKRELGGKLSKWLAAKLERLQLGKCACGCKQRLGNDYHLDHIMPLALGGTNTDENIQLLRKTCNLQKHAKHPVDFMQERGFLI